MISRNIKNLQFLGNVAIQRQQLVGVQQSLKYSFSTTPEGYNGGQNKDNNRIQQNRANMESQQNINQNKLKYSYTKKMGSDSQNKLNFQGKYFNLNNPIFEYKGNRKALSQWLYTPTTYTNNLNQNEIKAFQSQVISNLHELNDEIDDINQAFNIYIKLFILLKTIYPDFLAHRFQYILQKIKHSSTDEEALYFLIMECLKFMRNQQKSQVIKQLPIFLILRLTLYINYKFQFIQILQKCEEIKNLQFMVEDMVSFVYDFHTNKLLRKINHERLHDFYDKIITVCHKINHEPSLQFSNCLFEISKNIDKISDQLLVFVTYKLSTIDHTSFGFKIDHIWNSVEERFLKNVDQLSLLNRKSFLYSLGKTVKVTQTSLQLYKLLIDINSLNKQRYEKHFMEYFGNLILSGAGRNIFEKKELEQLLPFIEELMEDEQIEKQDKIQFIIEISIQLYRAGVYDQRFWQYFFKYESYYLNDKQQFFPLFFITKTIPVLADEINNKEFVNKCAELYEKVLQLPQYQQEISKVSSFTTQSKQSLFEQRFGFFANAFGRRLIREKIIDDVFSSDFFIEKEKIVIEIEGHNHYNQFADGTYKKSLVTSFKSKYLEKKGFRVIHLGVPEFQLPDNQQISILRVFQQQYNKIMEEKQQENINAASTN